MHQHSDNDNMNFVLKKQKNKNMWISGFMSIKKKGFESLYIKIFLTCPFRQLTKKSTCPTQSFSWQKKKKKNITRNVCITKYACLYKL